MVSLMLMRPPETIGPRALPALLCPIPEFSCLHMLFLMECVELTSLLQQMGQEPRSTKVSPMC